MTAKMCPTNWRSVIISETCVITTFMWTNFTEFYTDNIYSFGVNDGKVGHFRVFDPTVTKYSPKRFYRYVVTSKYSPQSKRYMHPKIEREKRRSQILILSDVCISGEIRFNEGVNQKLKLWRALTSQCVLHFQSLRVKMAAYTWSLYCVRQKFQISNFAPFAHINLKIEVNSIYKI